MKWTYIGGLTASEHESEVADDRGRVVRYDERQGVEMPDSTVAFGVKFIVGKPVDVVESLFRDKASYQHAISKLKTNQFFELSAEAVEYEDVTDEPPAPVERKKGSKAKPVDPEPAPVE